MNFFTRLTIHFLTVTLTSPRLASLALAIVFLALSNPAFAEFSWVERPDPMHNHRLVDSDMVGDTVRVLYFSAPSLPQSASGDWTVNVYIAELHADGRVENRLLASGQRNFSSLVLQRGGDAVFAVTAVGHGQKSDTLEVWSAADGTLLNTIKSDLLAGIGGAAIPVFPADDGNFFIVHHSAQSGRGGEPTTLTWVKMSPQGDELFKESWSDPTAITGLGGAFPVAGGGLGIVLNKRLAEGAKALQTDIEAIQQFEIGGRTIEARVFAETRLLSIDASGAIQWTSPAVERQIMWDGEMGIPQNLPADQMMAQSNEQMALMRSVEMENGGRRTIQHQATTIYDDIQRGPQGYGMLAKVAADRSLSPPVHGVWLIEIGIDGTLNRELRIEPVAESLDGKLERLLLTSDGGMLVAGPHNAGASNLHVTALDSEGNASWTAPVGGEVSQLEGIAGSAEAPWAFGQAWSDTHGKSLLWVELVDPNSAQPLEIEAAASQPVPTQAPSAAAIPSFEMPEPPEGCECSCEEYAAIQEIMERMKSASQADLMAMIQDPAYQKATNCAGGCAMAYAQCR